MAVTGASPLPAALNQTLGPCLGEAAKLTPASPTGIKPSGAPREGRPSWDTVSYPQATATPTPTPQVQHPPCLGEGLPRAKDAGTRGGTQGRE